jgi:hypothetical protein
MADRFCQAFGLPVAASIGIGLASVPTMAVADTISGFINDNTSYSQTNNSGPTTPFGYFFVMGAFFSTAGDFTSGSATYPGPGSPQPLASSSPTQLQYETGYYPSLAVLHTNYPFGTYTITASGPAGAQTAKIPYSADYFASPTPYLTNYSNLSGLNPTASFTVTYPSFTPNSSTNLAYTFFTVYNASTGAMVFGNEFQSPSSTSTTIPANTLAPNTNYNFELDFDNRISGTDSADGTFIQQQFDLRTDGSFTTGAAPSPVIGQGVSAFLGLGGLLFGAKLMAGRKRAIR